MNRTTTLVTVLALVLGWLAPQAHSDAVETDATDAATGGGAIAAAIADPARPSADREQDATRKPDEILAFLGVAPGMRVLDAFSASGYYTELLARIVGGEGEVIAYNNPPYAKFAAKGIAARYADDRLPNVRQVTAEVDELELPPRSLDAALFVMSYHDLYWQPADGSWARTDPMQMLRKLHAAMKVGGVVVVQDHVAVPGDDVAEIVDKLHRIDPAIVKRDFKAAGFALEAESDALAHPDDDHTLGVFDPKIRGRTDQFLMKFRRPGP
jgi:predicted methyltransferase